MSEELQRLEPNQPIVYGGNKITRVSPELAEVFQPGDRLVVVQETGDLLHIPARQWLIASEAVSRASQAFSVMGSISDDQITAFFDCFASRLADDSVFAAVAEANLADLESARQRGRSTTRLALDHKMRSEMIHGLEMWRDTEPTRGQLTSRLEHNGWTADQHMAPLGVVGFVFEGRPNVFADASGVIRSGNTVVFRIGSDALGTARAIVAHVLNPALSQSGLPSGAAVLVDSESRAAGWALFSDPTLGLAVARGSGEAVDQLGAVARQVGTPVSLHGTGGAWMMAGDTADVGRVAAVVEHSLDRKVCNTLNTFCALSTNAARVIPAVLDGLQAAAAKRGTNPKLHVTSSAAPWVPSDWFERKMPINRAHGDLVEVAAEPIGSDQLGHEWEWEGSPEITVAVFDSVEEAIRAFNTQSPRFAASLISEDSDEQERFWGLVDSPFVGDGFTRWVDGQYAFNKPELGLSNWDRGRLFARGAVLSGDSVFTIRARARQADPDLAR